MAELVEEVHDPGRWVERLDAQMRRAYRLGIAEGRRQAAEAIRAAWVTRSAPAELKAAHHPSLIVAWAARIAEGSTDDRLTT